MSYKKGLSKSRFKQTMKMFWTEKWNYKRTPEVWVGIISGEFKLVPNQGSPVMNKMESEHYRNKQKELLFSAIDKLVLERKLGKEQGENLKEMIESPDHENALVAITVMATVKPKKFKKLINN